MQRHGCRVSEYAIMWKTANGCNEAFLPGNGSGDRKIVTQFLCG